MNDTTSNRTKSSATTATMIDLDAEPKSPQFNISDQSLFPFQETPGPPQTSPMPKELMLGMEFVLDDFEYPQVEKVCAEKMSKINEQRRPTLENMRSGFELDYAFELKEAILEFKLEHKIKKLKERKKKRPKLNLFRYTK